MQIVMPLLSFLVILTLNLLLAKVIVAANHQRKSQLLADQLLPANSNTDRNAQKLLTACVTLYLCTQFPAGILNILSVWNSYLPASQQPFGRELNHIRTPLLDINYSSNFYVYCLASPRFRKSLMRHVSERRTSTSGTLPHQKPLLKGNHKVIHGSLTHHASKRPQRGVRNLIGKTTSAPAV